MSIDIAWMAWTWATGIFFILLALTLTVMTVLAVRYPETERIGILRIPTTRGDRLFISLLAAAFIHLLFLGFFGAEPMFTLPVGEDGIAVSRLWVATMIAFLNATAIFKWV